MGLGTIAADIIEKIKSLSSAFMELVKSNIRILIIIAAAILVIILLLLVLFVVTYISPESKQADHAGYSGDTNNDIVREALPGEDFFLPYEPDFVPDALLEREPKDGWTEEDARPFWTDPLEGNESFWRRRIESGIDSLLEHVP